MLSTGVVGQVGTRKIPEDDDDWRFGVGQEPEALPDHEAGSHDRCKVEYLQQDLEVVPRIGSWVVSSLSFLAAKRKEG